MLSSEIFLKQFFVCCSATWSGVSAVKEKVVKFHQFQNYYSGRWRRVIKWASFFIFIYFFLRLPILHFERCTLADSSSHVRPSEPDQVATSDLEHKCHIFSPCGVHQFYSLVCLYFIANLKALLHWRFLLRFCCDFVAISRRFQIARVNYWRFHGDLNRQ